MEIVIEDSASVTDWAVVPVTVAVSEVTAFVTVPLPLTVVLAVPEAATVPTLEPVGTLTVELPLSTLTLSALPLTVTVLPLFATLEKLDHSLLEAASDLGSRPWRAFVDVTLPLAMPGIIAGSMLVFIPAVGEFVIPTLLGGPDNLMIGRVLWDEFFGNRDWPVASAVAIVFLVLLVGPIALYQHYSAKDME